MQTATQNASLLPTAENCGATTKRCLANHTSRTSDAKNTQITQTGSSMPLDPTERNVNPLLFQTGIRTVKELVLAMAIHDKNVTMAKAAQVSFIIRTGLTFPSEDCSATKTHWNNELGFTALLKQQFVIAMPTNTSAIPCEGSGSRQSAPPPQHTMASSEVR